MIGRIPDAELGRLFARAKACGMGIELNFNSFAIADKDMNAYLRPYRIAKETGCLFCFGSDAHHPGELMEEKANAEHIIDLLDLKETDKFRI